MPEFLSPGVRIRELRAGVPQIRGVPTSIGAFVGRCLRGPTHKAVRITSFAQFQRIFGSYDANSYLPESVDAFFKNGGSECYVVRVVGSTGGGAANTNATKTTNTAGAVAAIVATAKGPGTDGNNYNILYGLENNKISSTIPALIPTGATTVFPLGVAICAKLAIGDVVRFQDTAGPDDVRIVVAGIANGSVVAAAAVTVPATGLAAATTSVTIETFSATVTYQGTVVYGPATGLRMSALSVKNYFKTRINVDDDEVPISVTDSLAPFGLAIDNRPVNTDTVNGDPLLIGDHFTTFADVDYIGASTGLGTGFYAFDRVKRIRLLACPGVTGVTAGAVSKALVQYAEARKDCFAFISPPASQTPTQVATYKADNIGSSSYGAMHYPWVKTLSPLTNQPTVTPMEGFAMGVTARCDREEGIADAPAGEVKGKLIGTIGVERLLNDADKDLLYPVNINPVEDISDVGQCIMGSRTLESGEFNQIHVRRTFIYLEQSLQIGTRFVIFEPNTPATRAKLKRAADAFLEAEWRKGTLTGASIEEAFSNVCNDSNNPDVVVKAQQMYMDTAVNVPQTTENLIINIQQDQRGTARVAA